VRVAVTGSGGRLGRAVFAAFSAAPFVGIFGPIAWSRPDYDLDELSSAARLVDRDRPDVIIHCAAWTDVDGCASQPALAIRRNGEAVGALATAAASAGADLVLVSTNEVFDGRRTDSRGYTPDDEPHPINAYGESKLAGELAAARAYGWSVTGNLVREVVRTNPSLSIVRTSWLYGPPGNDFPEKIGLAAQRALAAGEALKLVADETGSPTYAPDLADGIMELIGEGPWYGGLHHLVNAGRTTRAGWARTVLATLGLEVNTQDVPSSTWIRASDPPQWAVLEPTEMPYEQLRPWMAALADYLPLLRRQLAAAASGRR